MWPHVESLKMSLAQTGRAPFVKTEVVGSNPTGTASCPYGVLVAHVALIQRRTLFNSRYGYEMRRAASTAPVKRRSSSSSGRLQEGPLTFNQVGAGSNPVRSTQDTTPARYQPVLVGLVESTMMSHHSFRCVSVVLACSSRRGSVTVSKAEDSGNRVEFESPTRRQRQA